MPRLNSDDKKLALLERIGEYKHILFNNNVKKQEKLDKWREIFLFAREQLNYWVPESAVFTYLRDAVWPNMRNAALQKRKKIRADASVDIGDDPSKFDLYFSPLEQKIFEIVSYYDTDVLDFSTVSFKSEAGNANLTTLNLIKKEILGDMEAGRETPGSCCEAGDPTSGFVNSEFMDADGGESSENEISSQKGDAAAPTEENSRNNGENNAESQLSHHQKAVAESYDATNNFIKSLKRKRFSTTATTTISSQDFENEKRLMHLETLRLQNEKLRKEVRLMEIQECKALLELRILEKQLSE